MARMKKVGTVFFARLFAVGFGLFGFLLGIVYSVGGAAYDLVTTQSVNLGTALAFLALAGMPLLFGFAGLVFGVIVAPMYNAWAHYSGGLEMDVEQ